MFLTESGKDEVGVRDRQEVALRLRTLFRAFAPHATGTHGDFGLQKLIAGTTGVIVGIDEAGKAGLLVGLQQLATAPHSGNECQSAGGKNQCLAQVDAAEK